MALAALIRSSCSGIPGIGGLGVYAYTFDLDYR